MDKLKLLIILSFAALFLPACFKTKAGYFVIPDSKIYEASLFRQHCAICHGPNGEGSTLENGTKVPSLREGEFKFHTEQEIRNQIAGGGNGMTPFRDILNAREIDLMAKFVHDKLRKP